jgi:L-serine dehydratase
VKKYNIFDILGPIMIGPSSSHTAGAARLGKIAAIIGGEKIRKVIFILHGSFAKTYRGHGTDRALVAGVLGLNPWDDSLKEALTLAKEKGLKYDFIEEDLGDVHPNTVKFILERQDGSIVEVVGASIGGGNIVISNVDGEEVQFTGEYPTLIITHLDVPGVVSKVTAMMYEENINIAFMKVFRGGRGAKATMIFETDSVIQGELISKIKSIANITAVRTINPLQEGI